MCSTLQWQNHNKGAALTRFAHHDDIAAVIHHRLVGNREPQLHPHPAIIGGESRIENSRGIVGRGTVFIAGEAGNAFRSRDGGTWEKLEVGYEGGLFGVVCSDDETQIYIYGLRGHVFRSDDIGDSWHPWETGSTANFYGGLCLGPEKFLLLGQGGTILVCNGTNGACYRIPRTDRRLLSAAIPVGNEKLLLVGEGGIELMAMSELARQ